MITYHKFTDDKVVTRNITKIGHNIPNQYWKCPETGLEYIFKFEIPYGWTVQFLGEELLNINTKLPWPETPQEYKKEIESYYKSIDDEFKKNE